MKVVSLIDDISHGACESEHGLSLCIELACGARVLFDTGGSDAFARNAARLGIDPAAVDIAVISHGHSDHAGGLATFLQLNPKAPVYIRESAFLPHYSLKPDGPKYIGLGQPDGALAAWVTESERPGDETAGVNGSERPGVKQERLTEANAGRLVFCGELEKLPYGITLFSEPERDFPLPEGNARLLGPDGKPDDFAHEQSMIVREGPLAVLFAGCAHRGIANILRRAQDLTGGSITHVFSGMHLCRGCEPSPAYITALADALDSLSVSIAARAAEIGPSPSSTGACAEGPGITRFYTMHCTGERGYFALKEYLGARISYLSSGQSVIL